MPEFLERPREGTLEHVVFKSLGVLDFDGQLSHKTVAAGVWRALNNNHPPDPKYKYAETPVTRMNHNLLKLPEEVFESDRRDELEGIKAAVRNAAEVKSFLLNHPDQQGRLDSVIGHALELHRIKSPFYWRESTTADPRYHKSIYTEAQNLPLEMNRYNARQLADFANARLNAGKEGFTIMDVGTGGGNTIRFALEEIRRLNPEHMRKITVVLNDIEDASINRVAESLTKDFGVNRVITVPSTFYAFAQGLGMNGMPRAWRMADDSTYKDIENLRGKVDAFTSFASFNNLPHSGLVFRTVHELLHKGGRAFIGDWSGYDVTKRSFSQRELDREIRQFRGNSRVTVRDNVKGIWWFWLHHHGYTELKTGQTRWWNRLERYIDRSPNVNVLDWFNRNHPKMEAERVKRQRKYTFFGYANRAYRTPEMVVDAAKKAGLAVHYAGYPMANATSSGDIKFAEFNPRFATWHAVLVKR